MSLAFLSSSFNSRHVILILAFRCARLSVLMFSLVTILPIQAKPQAGGSGSRTGSGDVFPCINERNRDFTPVDCSARIAT
jgi:hypothetical protein